MPRGPNDKKFEADIPRTMWDAFETWAQHRGPINNRQLCQALFRLFLAAPEGVKLLALYGRGDQLEMAAEVREDLLAAGILDAAEADATSRAETPAASAKTMNAGAKKRIAGRRSRETQTWLPRRAIRNIETRTLSRRRRNTVGSGRKVAGCDGSPTPTSARRHGCKRS